MPTDLDFYAKQAARPDAMSVLPVQVVRQVIAEAARYRAALEKCGRRDGYNSGPCWCFGWGYCLDQPQCLAARAALAEPVPAASPAR